MDQKEMKMALVEVKKLCEKQTLCSKCPLSVEGHCPACDAPEFWRTEKWEEEMQREKTVTITKSGVAKICSWRETEIAVNDQDMVELLEKEIEKKKPVMDRDNGFAARVTVIVELLGDLEESQDA